MSNVVTFPLKGTPIAAWFNEATQQARQVNMTAARVWVKENVPAQFQDLILRNIKVT